MKKVTFEDSTSAQQQVFDQKLTEACQTYISGTSDLLKNTAMIADLFVKSVNHQPNIKKYIKRTKFWGTGYRSSQVGHGTTSDIESSSSDDDDDNDHGSNQSTEFDTASYDSDLSIDSKSKTESIQQSFEKMFGKMEKYIKE